MGESDELEGGGFRRNFRSGEDDSEVDVADESLAQSVAGHPQSSVDERGEFPTQHEDFELGQV